MWTTPCRSALITAIRPFHDLGVLYILGDWNPQEHDPSTALRDLGQRLLNEFENPTSHRVTIELQTHSVTIRFLDGDEEVFAVDVVPAYSHKRNDRGEDMCVFPEIARASHSERRRIRAAVARGEQEIAWIPSDPRGYISVARYPQADIFDMAFAFFCDLPDLIRYPQIPDRADSSRIIDDYVSGLTEQEHQHILEARDGFLIALENLEEKDLILGLLEAPRRLRAGPSEAYLFDQRIPVFAEYELSIVATALEKQGNFLADHSRHNREDQRRSRDRVPARPGSPEADLFKWKVKNDDAAHSIKANDLRIIFNLTD